MALRAGVSAGAAAVLTLIAGCSGSSGPGGSPTAPVQPAGHRTSGSSSPTPPKVTRPTKPPLTKAQIKAQVTTRIEKIIHAQPSGGVSVAALNTVTGAHFAAGATSGMWTASAYKLFELSALLIGRSPSSLSSAENADAENAIEHSDNVAGYSLFLDAGGRSGLSAAAQTFGMKHTVPGESDPTFTTTSGSDYLRLLKQLVGPGALSKASRQYILNLMEQVEPDQRWGVGVVADKHDDFANKNGWLSIDDSNGPGETDNGLWAVTSAGVVTVHHQQVLMAVFTRHQQSYGSGVALVQKLAKTLVPAVSG
jgi:beta-lactamase class A